MGVVTGLIDVGDRVWLLEDGGYLGKVAGRNAVVVWYVDEHNETHLIARGRVQSFIPSEESSDS